MILRLRNSFELNPSCGILMEYKSVVNSIYTVTKEKVHSTAWYEHSRDEDKPMRGSNG